MTAQFTTTRLHDHRQTIRASSFGILSSFVIRHSPFAALIAFASLTIPTMADDQRCASGRSVNRHAIAGWPQCVAPWAKPSFGCHEYGYYVGGGAAWHGDARCPHEGTWGWDYHGRLCQKRIWLGWHHGRKEQGGVGAYQTDGPHLFHH